MKTAIKNAASKLLEPSADAFDQGIHGRLSDNPGRASRIKSHRQVSFNEQAYLLLFGAKGSLINGLRLDFLICSHEYHSVPMSRSCALTNV